MNSTSIVSKPFTFDCGNIMFFFSPSSLTRQPATPTPDVNFHTLLNLLPNKRLNSTCLEYLQVLWDLRPQTKYSTLNRTSINFLQNLLYTEELLVPMTSRSFALSIKCFRTYIIFPTYPLNFSLRSAEKPSTWKWQLLFCPHPQI